MRSKLAAALQRLFSTEQPAVESGDGGRRESRPGPTPEFLWNPTRTELITTKFMRNRVLFSALAEHFLPQLRARHQRPLRLLFWACSTGCEPYTLKFLLGPESQDEIVGIDQDAGAIAQAKQGTYGAETWKMFFEEEKMLLTPEEVGRFFDPVGRGAEKRYSVAKPYRWNLRFLTGDLFSGSMAVSPADFDLVVCNNLLLHLKPHSAGLAWDYLLRYLHQDGLLLVAGCNPIVRRDAAKRLGLHPRPEKLVEISRNWCGVSGGWDFNPRPAWAYMEPNENDPDYHYLAGEIFQRGNRPDVNPLSR